MAAHKRSRAGVSPRSDYDASNGAPPLKQPRADVSPGPDHDSSNEEPLSKRSQTEVSPELDYDSSDDEPSEERLKEMDPDLPQRNTGEADEELADRVEEYRGYRIDEYNVMLAKYKAGWSREDAKGVELRMAAYMAMLRDWTEHLRRGTPKEHKILNSVPDMMRDCGGDLPQMVEFVDCEIVEPMQTMYGYGRTKEFPRRAIVFYQWDEDTIEVLPQLTDEEVLRLKDCSQDNVQGVLVMLPTGAERPAGIRQEIGEIRIDDYFQEGAGEDVYGFFDVTVKRHVRGLVTAVLGQIQQASRELIADK